MHAHELLLIALCLILLLKPSIKLLYVLYFFALVAARNVLSGGRWNRFRSGLCQELKCTFRLDRRSTLNNTPFAAAGVHRLSCPRHSASHSAHPQTTAAVPRCVGRTGLPWCSQQWTQERVHPAGPCERDPKNNDDLSDVPLFPIAHIPLAETTWPGVHWPPVLYVCH